MNPQNLQCIVDFIAVLWIFHIWHLCPCVSLYTRNPAQLSASVLYFFPDPDSARSNYYCTDCMHIDLGLQDYIKQVTVKEACIPVLKWHLFSCETSTWNWQNQVTTKINHCNEQRWSWKFVMKIKYDKCISLAKKRSLCLRSTLTCRRRWYFEVSVGCWQQLKLFAKVSEGCDAGSSHHGNRWRRLLGPWLGSSNASPVGEDGRVTNQNTDHVQQSKTYDGCFQCSGFS